MIERGSDNVIDANTFNTVQGQGANITVTRGARNHITNNVTKGGVTAILFMWSRSSNGGGLDSIIEDNVVTGNACSGYSEEGISFDLKANDGADAGALEYDAVRAVNGQTLTLTATGFPNYVGYDVVSSTARCGAAPGPSPDRAAAPSPSREVLPGPRPATMSPSGPATRATSCAGTQSPATRQNPSARHPLRPLLRQRHRGQHDPGRQDQGDVPGLHRHRLRNSATGTRGRAPCGYNTVRDNRVQDSTGRVYLEFYSLGGSLAPFVSEGNNVIGNTTPIVAADYQYMYLSYNSGTTALGNTTKAASEFVYDGQ